MKVKVDICTSERVVALLGSSEVLNIAATDFREPARATKAVRNGLPGTCARYLRENSGVPKRLFDQVVPRTTLISAGKSKSKRLSKHASEVVLRVARIIAFAEDTFGDQDRAMNWLNNPNHVFEGQAPITLADTESGTEWVEQVLGRMMYGIDA
ncbi:MbcA/ParS/Xre antitoxin family protein [Salinisphaera dokdonensis]|uniref:MbcA/ParS/Xre antitoxin family protein n=1 Tax=Salinisphaera dokdonensis TaxID=454598 RepID=UPI00333F41DD